MKSIDFKDFREFKTMLLKSLGISEHFKIMCLNEEEKEIKEALKFGTLKDYDWEDGKVIEGEITGDLIEYFKSLKHEDSEDNKFLPFFALWLDDKICFELYGERNYIK